MKSEIPICPCGNPTHLNKAYPERGYTKYCSDSCSKKYRSLEKSYNQILSNKDWLYDNLIVNKRTKISIAKELGCSETVVNKWIRKHELLLIKNKDCPELISVDYESIDPDIELNKDNLEYLLKTYTNKTKLCNRLNLKPTQFRKIIESFGIEYDGRKFSNSRRKLDIPDKEILIDLYENQNLTLLDISKKFNTSNVTVKKWFRHHNIELLEHAVNMRKKILPKCKITMLKNHGNEIYFATDTAKKQIANTFIQKYGVPYHPIDNISKTEKEVIEYFNTLEDGFMNTKIFGIELDGYNPKINVAVEFCGIYWHSEKQKGKDLHRKKYEICKSNGIRLFTIFEDEWLYRKNQVKSFIRSSLNGNNERIYARNLTIERCAARNSEVLNFIDKHHIQGCPSVLSVICHYILKGSNENIIAVMSFSKHPRNESEIVLSRYCVKSNVDIIGGSSRLFKHAIEYFKCDIKTWSDNRWTEGLMYGRLGFELHKELPKDYSYSIGGSKCCRIPKQSMTKRKIGASADQTEYQRALELGFDRIWDCGKRTWLYRYKRKEP